MKRTILIAALGVAFAAVSLWLILSGGRSRRATRLKYRLGGAMLSLMALTSTSCERIITTCYDVYIPENSHYWDGVVANSELRNGDSIMLSYMCEFGSKVTALLVSDDGENRVLCSQTYDVKYGESLLSFTIDAGAYRGKAKLGVEYVKYNEGDPAEQFFIYVSIVD